MATVITKSADAKGRVTLGSAAANRLVSVTQVSESEFVIKLVRAIPEDEAWLYENPKALAAVRTGLQQARAGKVIKGAGKAPNLETDEKLSNRLED